MNKTEAIIETTLKNLINHFDVIFVRLREFCGENNISIYEFLSGYNIFAEDILDKNEINISNFFSTIKRTFLADKNNIDFKNNKILVNKVNDYNYEISSIDKYDNEHILALGSINKQKTDCIAAEFHKIYNEITQANPKPITTIEPLAMLHFSMAACITMTFETRNDPTLVEPVVFLIMGYIALLEADYINNTGVAQA